MCDQISEDAHIKAEGKAGRMGQQLMAVVAEGHHGRKYLEATDEHVAAAEKAQPEWGPEQELANDPRNLWCIPYGLTTFADLFTPRQLVALGTFSDLVAEAGKRTRNDALASGLSEERASAYATILATYLGLGVSKSADYWSALCAWRSDSKNLGIGHVFSKQALAMIWDYCEAQPFSSSSGNWVKNVEWMQKVLAGSRASRCK